MARTVKPLTELGVLNALPSEKEYNISDGYGLAIRVKPNGTKSWIYNYYHPDNGKRLCMSFGTYPVISLTNARDQRSYYRKLLIDGIDPKKHRDKLNVLNKNLSNTIKNYDVFNELDFNDLIESVAYNFSSNIKHNSNKDTNTGSERLYLLLEKLQKTKKEFFDKN